MRMALALAGRKLGDVWPNPAVGCVLVQGDRIVGRGWTGTGGRPHAESEALTRAGAAARGATAYVSLEPCVHHGKTPPCAQALIKAGIAEVVVAMRDPDPRVDGKGIDILAKAGIRVEEGIAAEQAAELNAGFVMRVRQGRPLVTWKTATSLDGRIAAHTGASRWITGNEARARVHLMRARHDAVMIGIGTALADDPALTCRLPGLEAQSPVRVVVDSRLRLPLTSELVRTAAQVPTWLVTLAHADRPRRAAYVDSGVEVLEVEADADGNVNLVAVLQALGTRGLTRVLVEGGGHLAAGLLRARLVDRVAWFRAGVVIGGDGVPAAVALGVDRLEAAPRFRRLSTVAVGQDLLETYAVEA